MLIAIVVDEFLQVTVNTVVPYLRWTVVLWIVPGSLLKKQSAAHFHCHWLCPEYHSYAINPLRPLKFRFVQHIRDFFFWVKCIFKQRWYFRCTISHAVQKLELFKIKRCKIGKNIIIRMSWYCMVLSSLLNIILWI